MTGWTQRRLLLAILVVNLVAIYAVLARSSASLPRWMAWLIDVAREACH